MNLPRAARSSALVSLPISLLSCVRMPLRPSTSTRMASSSFGSGRAVNARESAVYKIAVDQVLHLLSSRQEGLLRAAQLAVQVIDT